MSKIFIGSTAEQIVQHSDLPVWIHRGSESVSANSVLIPCDLTDRAAHTLKFLKKNNIGKSKTELLHVQQLPMPFLDYEDWKVRTIKARQLNDARLKKFKNKYPSLKVVDESGDVFGQIEKRSKKFDVIALSPRLSKSFLEGFGSVSSKIVRASCKPVLVIP